MAAAASTRPRWFHPTPDRLVLGLLVVECLLWLSDRFRWFPFNQHKNWTVLIALAAVGAAMLLMGLWFVAGLLFRWRFQFSIRSLLVLVVVVAIPCSWLATEMRKAKEQREAARAIEKLGGEVYWDESIAASWLGRLFGEGFFGSASAVDCTTEYGLKPRDTDAALENLAVLSELKTLTLTGSDVTDVGMKNLKGLSQLEQLYLRDTLVTDAGLKNLTRLSKLQELDLANTRVTDAGLEHLTGLSQLWLLDLISTQITDAGLEHLKGLTELRLLDVSDTKVTYPEGLVEIRFALPECEIRH